MIRDLDGELWPFFKGRTSPEGWKLRGGPSSVRNPVAVFRFDGVQPPRGADGESLPFIMRLLVERGGSERGDRDELTMVQAIARNRKTGQESAPVLFNIESGRSGFFSLPDSVIGDGDFDVLVRCVTRGNYLSIRSQSLQAVTARHQFIANLAKSVFILWLMALLVGIVGVFTSTFLSWPIAFVLTVVILLGHWGVQEVSESGSGSALARSVVTDFFPGADPGLANTVTSSVEGLSNMLDAFSHFLPDIGQFSAIEDIQRGVNIAPRTLLDSLEVIGLFGLPMIVLGYVFLKRKEVAP
jgi:hypothetical protein